MNNFVVIRGPDYDQGQKGSMQIPIKILSLGVATLLTSMLFTCGCSRKSSNTPVSQIPVQTNPASESAYTTVVPQGQPIQGNASLVQTDGQPNLAELNRVARLWLLRNQRRPTGWDDFAAHAGVQIPPPPTGKKYVLSRSMRVTLEDR
jgi:hypothetical protein